MSKSIRIVGNQMGKAQKIGIWQVFSIIFLSRLLTVLTYTSIGEEKMETSDYFPSVLFSGLFILLFSVMLFVQNKKYPGKDLTDIAYMASPWFSKVISAVYALIFTLSMLVTLARLELFVGTIIFPENDSALFIIICVLASCYAASLGIEALGRVSALSVMISGAAFLFIMVTMVDKIDVTQFSPVFFDGLMPPVKGGLSFASRTVEIVILSALLPKINGKPMRAYFTWLGATVLSMLSLFFFVFGGLGKFALTQLFPVHSVAVLAEVGVFRRFDVLLTGVWILSAFIKISLLLYLQAELLQKSFKAEWKNYYIFVVGGLALVAQIFLAGNFTDYFYQANFITRFIYFAVVVLVIPAMIMLCAYIKRRKTDEKNA